MYRSFECRQRTSRRRLAQPTPGPAGDNFNITCPSPTRSVRVQSHATSTRPRQRVSNLTGRLPGLAREVIGIFSLFLRAVSPRGFEAATCSLARAPRLLWGVARSLQIGVRSRVCHAPIPAFGYRWCGMGYAVS